MNAALALQKAMRDALLARPGWTVPVHDHVPQGAAAPHVYFGPAETRDWSTQTEKAHEHFITLRVKSKAGGKKEAQAIIAEIEAALDNAVLPLSGHRLVNLRMTLWSAERDGDRYNGMARFRAATEVL
jgi:Protein of unknown function (DUF3168)